MIDCELNEITEADLQRLIDLPVTEGERIEYKRELNLTSDDVKRKFLASIASFANAKGGDLIFGMEAVDGRPLRITPLADFSLDPVLLQINALIRSGIAPIVYTVNPRSVPVTNGEVFVLRVPRTWAGPHMVTYNGDNRFYTRHSTGRVPMVLPEIRTAFALADTTLEKVQRFRYERLAAILSREAITDLRNGPAVVFHVVPVGSVDPGYSANLSAFDETEGRNGTWPIHSLGAQKRYHFDGVYFSAFNERGGTPTGYIFAFRSGALEILDTLCFREDPNVILGRPIEKHIFSQLPEWFAQLRAMNVEPPVVLLLSFLNVRGYRIATGMHPTEGAVTRDHLHVPGVVVESLDVALEHGQPLNRHDILRPQFDAFWNACGRIRSPNFFPTGKFRDDPL